MDGVPDPRDTVDIPLLISRGEGGENKRDGPRGRPWLRLWFACAGLYARAYRNKEGTYYSGRCPRCGKSIRFMVGPCGTRRRQFEVSC